MSVERAPSGSSRFAEVGILFVAGFGPIVRDAGPSRQLYERDLGIPFEETDGYLHTDKLPGCKAFALWPLSQAAASCFGGERWPDHLPIPQAWLEFDVVDVPAATATLEERGYAPLVRNRSEPWGQVVSRFLSPEGLLIGVTQTPWMREARPPPRKATRSGQRSRRRGPSSRSRPRRRGAGAHGRTVHPTTRRSAPRRTREARPHPR